MKSLQVRPSTCFMDRDGTFFGTCYANFAAYQASFEVLGIITPTNLFEEIHHGAHISDILSNAGLDLPINVINELRDTKSRLFINFLEEVKINESLLERAYSFERRFIVTNSSYESTQILIDSFVPNSFEIQRVYTPVGNISPKPSPDLYLLALSESGNTPDEIVVFEDSENGLISAKKAGLKVSKVKHIC